MRGEDTSDELIKKLQLTPYSREEYYKCRDTWMYEEDEVEKARKFYVATLQSFSSIGNGEWGYAKTSSRRGMSARVSSWLSSIDKNMVDVVERLREIQIEHLDILDLIKKYDTPDTLFYLDPPYISQSRSSKEVYKYEMSEEQHKMLANNLLSIKSKVILSGYDNDIYNVLEDIGWYKILLGEYAKFSSKKEKKDKGKEYVWVNYSVNNIGVDWGGSGEDRTVLGCYSHM